MLVLVPEPKTRGRKGLICSGIGVGSLRGADGNWEVRNEVCGCGCG